MSSMSCDIHTASLDCTMLCNQRGACPKGSLCQLWCSLNAPELSTWASMSLFLHLLPCLIGLLLVSSDEKFLGHICSSDQFIC